MKTRAHMITADANTVTIYGKWLEKKATGLDLTDPDDRATFRADVMDALTYTKVSALRGVLAAMGAENVPVTRNAVCRALAETQIKKVTA